MFPAQYIAMVVGVKMSDFRSVKDEEFHERQGKNVVLEKWKLYYGSDAVSLWVLRQSYEW